MMESNITKSMIYVGGSKGGTGKSLVSMALVDYLRKVFPKDEILLFETDSSNPDVGRLYKKTKGVTVENLALNEEENNWSDLIDIVKQSNASRIIINSMSGSNLGVEAQGYFLNEAIDQQIINVDFKCLWVMNRDRDSVDLLRQFMEQMRYATVYPIKNTYFGKEDEFNYYQKSDAGVIIREMILKRGGQSFNLPELNQKLTYKLYTEQLNFEEIREDISGGMKISLGRWAAQVESIFDFIFLPSAFKNGATAPADTADSPAEALTA